MVSYLCRKAALALMSGVFLMMAWTPPACAHASLIGTQPADQSVLAKAPSQVELRFNESVSPLVFTLMSPDGAKIALDHIRQRNTRVSVDVPPLNAQGTFAMSWRVVSADGHPVGGTLVFSVGAPSGAGVVAPATNTARMAAIWLVRALLYAGLFFGIGGALFRAFLAPAHPPAGRLAVAALSIGLLMLPFAAGLQGLDALDAPASAWHRLAIWQTAFSTTYGMTVGLFALALCSAIGSFRATGGWARRLALAALLWLGLGLAASGHASDAAPQWLTRPAVWLHGIAVAVWIGSLAPLRRLLVRPDNAAQDTVRRFSRSIAWVLVVLAGSGLALVYVQFDGLQSLWQTAYGQVFMVKMGLLAALLCVAAYNRYRLTAAVLHGEPHAAALMRRLIGVEIGLVVCILMVVAVWRFTPPPRALADAARVAVVAVKPVYAHIHTPAAMADITIFAPQGGKPARMQFLLMDGDLIPLNPKQATVYFSNAAAGIEPIKRRARRTADGVWHIDRLDLPAVDRWTVRIDALMSDFDRISLEGEISIGLCKSTIKTW